MCNACWWLLVRLQQMLRLIELEKSVVEGGGAVGVAALLQEGLLPELRVRSYLAMFVDVLSKGDVVELVVVAVVCVCGVGGGLLANPGT